MNLWDLTYKKAIVTGAAQGLSRRKTIYLSRKKS